MARRGGGGGGRPGGGGGAGGGGSRGRGSQVTLDADAFAVALRKSLAAMKVRSEADLQRVGIRVQNRARVLCPVDTGRLRSSIQHKMGQDANGPYVEIGSNVQYASDVEFGTQRNRARPYLRPALLEVMTRGLLRGG